MTPAEILKRGAEIRRSMTSAAALEDEYDDAYFFGAPFAATSGPSGHDQPTSAWGNHQVIGGSSSSVMTQLPSVPSVNNTWEGGEAASPNTKWQHNNIIQERLRNVVNKVSETKKKPCPFFAQGYCKYGEFCRYSHEAAAVTAEPATTLAGGPNDDSVQQDHQQQFLDEERNEDHCAICLEHPADRFRRFGILPACEHVFCLPCIRTWRKSNNDMNSSNGRRCPICRYESFFVMPSFNFVRNGPQKDLLKYCYHKSMQNTPCKLFLETGQCKFGSSCFYKHVDRQGNEVAPEVVRLRIAADGTALPLKTKFSLADYIKR